MSLFLNTLYVTTHGARVSKDHETIAVSVNEERTLAVPFHHLSSLVCLGSVHVSPQLMQACSERGIAITWLSEYGRFLARVEGHVSGNVLLRRAQFARADGGLEALGLARGFVIGKLLNARTLLQRSARETDAPDDQARLEPAIQGLSRAAERALEASDLDVLRGIEGDGAALYGPCSKAGSCRNTVSGRTACASTSSGRRPCAGPNTTASGPGSTSKGRCWPDRLSRGPYFQLHAGCICATLLKPAQSVPLWRG